MFSINKDTNIPVYYQLRSKILKMIESGEYEAGRPIPSEREMSEALNISRMTVRQALNQLVSEGILYRERGKGTFVSKTKIVQTNVMSFSDLVSGKGMIPNTRVLHFEKGMPSEGIKRVLELESGDQVYVLKRLRLANSIPIGIEEVFLPEKFCPGFERFDPGTSLYRLIREKYNHSINFIDSSIESSRASKEEKKLLEIVGNIPLLRISGINYTSSGIKLFYERSAYRADEYRYSVRVYVNKNIE